jgi:predicted nucleic acid-binding protein
MAVRDRLYVDANIFINTFEARDEVGACVLQLFLSQSSTRPDIITSDLALAEVLVGPFRERNDDLVETYQGWMISNPAIMLAPVNRDALVVAALLRADYPTLRLADAVHIAIAIGMECSKLLTADKRLAGTYRIANPRYGISTPSVAVEIVRPEIAFLKALSAGAAP